jgi:hypothetical protein
MNSRNTRTPLAQSAAAAAALNIKTEAAAVIDSRRLAMQLVLPSHLLHFKYKLDSTHHLNDQFRPETKHYNSFLPRQVNFLQP